MIDRHNIRENTKEVKESFKNRGEDTKILDQFLKKDIRWRELKKELDDFRAERNTLGKKISELKKSNKKADKEIKRSGEISKETKEKEEEVEKLEKWLKDNELCFPNLLSPTTPKGKDETENPEIRTWGKVKKFAKDVLPHDELGKMYGVLDFER